MFFSDDVGIEFIPFSWVHLLLFVFVLGGIWLIIGYRKKIAILPWERRLAIGMASFAFIWEIGLYLWKIGNGLWTWDDGLPLGLCGMTLYVAMGAMFFKNKTLFSIGYYWTWGAIASILFPDILFSYDRFRFYQFMIGHMFFFFMYVYMIAVYKWIPTLRMWRQSVVVLFIITMIFILVSNITNTNLMFMRESEGTPLSMFEGHGYFIYIIGVMGLAFLLMTVWQLPWHMINKRKDKL